MWIIDWQVEHERNFPLAAELLANFAHPLPRKLEFQADLTFVEVSISNHPGMSCTRLACQAALETASQERKLNPQFRASYEHEAVGSRDLLS